MEMGLFLHPKGKWRPDSPYYQPKKAHLKSRFIDTCHSLTVTVICDSQQYCWSCSSNQAFLFALLLALSL